MTYCRESIIVARPGPDHKYAGADWTINYPMVGMITLDYVRQRGMEPLYKINFKAPR